MSSFGPTSFAPTSGSLEAQVPGIDTAEEWGPVSAAALSGRAFITGGDPGKPLWGGNLSVQKFSASVLLGADPNAYGVVHNFSVTALVGADPNAYGVVHNLQVGVVLGNDPNVPGTVRKSAIAVVLGPIPPGSTTQLLSINT